MTEPTKHGAKRSGTLTLTLTDSERDARLRVLRAMTGRELDLARICRLCWESYSICVCRERNTRVR